MRIFLILVACAGPLVAIIFATHAGWSALARAYDAPVASGVIAAVYLGVGSIAAAASLLLRAGAARAGDKAPPESRSRQAGSPLATLELAMRKAPYQTTAILVGLGVLIGKKPEIAAEAVRKFI